MTDLILKETLDDEFGVYCDDECVGRVAQSTGNKRNFDVFLGAVDGRIATTEGLSSALQSIRDWYGYLYEGTGFLPD